jgi:hypothetical protein
VVSGTAGVAPAVVWAQVACLVTRCRAARIRSAVTASAAVSSAAPAAIRAICQPGVPPMTTVWIAGGHDFGSAQVGWWWHGESVGRGLAERQRGAGEPGQHDRDTADVAHDGLLWIGRAA